MATIIPYKWNKWIESEPEEPVDFLEDLRYIHHALKLVMASRRFDDSWTKRIAEWALRKILRGEKYA